MGKDHLQDQFDKTDAVLKEYGEELERNPELKSALEKHRAMLAVFMMSSWLPKDSVRKLIMLIILIVGISGLVAGKPILLLLLLLLPFFSPRVVRDITIFIGKFKS